MKTNTGTALMFGIAILLAMPAEGHAQYRQFEMERLVKRRDKALRDIESATEEGARLEASVAESADEADHIRTIEDGTKALLEERRQSAILVDELEPQLRDLVLMLTAYQDAFSRLKADFEVGEELGSLELPSGQILEEAIVTAVGPGYLSIRHTSGIGRYDFAALPPEMRARCPIPPESIGKLIDLAELLAAKPNSLKTSDQIHQEIKDKVALERRERSEKIEAARRMRAAETEAKLAVRQRLEAEIAKLVTSRNEVSAAIARLQVQKGSRREALYSGGIKPSAANINSAMAPYDRRIEQLERQRAELEKKLAAARAKL